MSFGLQLIVGKLEDAQARLSSGRRINRFSDAPTDDATAWLGSQDQALQSASSLLRRARELALSAANGTVSPEGREAIASELSGLRDNLASLANTSYLGRSVFGGFQKSAVAQPVPGGPWAWSGGGSADAVLRRVAPEVTVQVNLNGQEVFGFAAGAGQDVFSVLDKLATDVRAGNTAAAVGGDLVALDARLADIFTGLATVGARTNQVEAARDTGFQRVDTIKQHRSSLEDTDIAESVMDLQVAQMGYQAVLGATARLSMPSLVDFLR